MTTHPGARADRPAQNLTLEKKKILFVDDEQGIRSALKRSFMREGYDIIFARSGEEALQLLAQYPVHLVVSDNKMPRMSGVELIKTIKNQHPDTHCMMLTGFEDPALETPQVSRCVEHVIHKPWNESFLKQVVRECLTDKPEQTVRPLPSYSIEEDRPLASLRPQKSVFDLFCYASAVGLAACIVINNQVVVEQSDAASAMAGKIDQVLSRMEDMQSLATSWASFDAG